MTYLLPVGFTIIILLGFFTVQKITNNILNTPPHNNPAHFLSQNIKDRPNDVIVNIGDSITHGVVSHNYSKIIAMEAKKHGFETINAGINADLAYSVVKRIDEIVACKPKIATILIGTNDVLSTFGNRKKNYWRFGRIPHGQETSLSFYLTNLNIIIDKLQTIPNIEIYIYSLPVLGEDLSSDANQKTTQYSEAAKELAKQRGLHYLPLNEKMNEYLTRHPSINALAFGKEQLAGVIAVIKHLYFGQDWNQIARSNHLQLTTETIHLSEAGANMVVNLALEEIAFNPLQNSKKEKSK